MVKKEGVACPKCSSSVVVKKGKRRGKGGTIQRYLCKNCDNRFSDKKMKNSTYSAKIVMNALSNYNRGLSLRESSLEINRRFCVKTYPKLISSWLERFEEICSFKRFRKSIGKFDNNVVFEKEFEHKMPYLFKYHKQKLELFINDYFKYLKEYLINIPEKCPNKLFNEDNFRCSQLDFCSGIEVKEKKNNYASKLAEFALKSIRTNYERHDFVEDFMLYNDSSTIAVEVPVWLKEKEIPFELKGILKIDKPLTGHIDILQMRYGLIHILDFKPEACKERRSKVASQLFAYSVALSVRTGKWLRDFKCGWFDEKNYYEFSPAEFVLDFFEDLEKKGDVKKIGEKVLRKYKLNKKSRGYYLGKKFNEKRLSQKGEKTLIEKIKDGEVSFKNN